MKGLNIILFLTISVSSFAQTIHVPLSRGGESGSGTLLSVNIDNGNYQSFFNNGASGLSNYNSNGDLGGMTYVSSNNSIYIVSNSGSRIAGFSQGYGYLLRYDITLDSLYTIYQFTENNRADFGMHPRGKLVQHGSNLYGVCHGGGDNDNGTLFSIDVSSNELTKEFDFNQGITGAFPTCSPILVGNTLYGGGDHATSDAGYMLYSYDLSNQTYNLEYEVPSGTNTMMEVKDLFEHNGLIYFNVFGGIHAFNPSNGSETVHYAGSNSLGEYATGFTYNGSIDQWFSVFQLGGANNLGSICRVNFSSPQIVNNHSFSTGSINPASKMVEGLLGDMYGVVRTDASTANSKLYKLDVNGIYSEIFSFSGGNEGEFVRMTPVFIGTDLYGISEEGGENESGVLWRFNTITSTFEVVKSFGFQKGAAPVRELVLVNGTDNTFEGIMNIGGQQDKGVFFTYNSSNSSYDYIPVNSVNSQQVLHPLMHSNGASYALITLKLNLATSLQSFTAIAEFDSQSGTFSNYIPITPSGIADVALPNSIQQSNVIIDGDFVYGANQAELWSVDLSNGSYTALHTFNTGTDGQNVYQIHKYNDKIYGTTISSGPNGNGALFEYDITLDQFNILYDSPNFSLNNAYKFSDDRILGASDIGGNLNHGVLYEYNLTSSTYSELASFDSINTGMGLSGNFTELGLKIYGVMSYGNDNGLGGIFEYDYFNNSLRSVIAFDTITGYYPWNATPVVTDGSLDFEESDAISVTIAPNPTSEIFTITSSEYIENLVLLDINGRKFRTIKNLKANTSFKIDVSDLKAGVYFLKSTGTSTAYGQKIIKL